MQPGIALLTLGLLLLFATKGRTQSNLELTTVDSSGVVTKPITKKRMNFFVISKPKKLFDPATRFNILRGKIRSLLRPKHFSCIVASSAEEMSKKIQYRAKKHDAIIGSLWFDSHGSYKKGYSLFTIGKDEFNHNSITKTELLKPLAELASLTDSISKIGIGSCYGGATYTKPGKEYERMNGDSLMLGVGTIFPSATIYACESWVMTKPGLFKERFAMAGSPLKKRFKDSSFEPVWNSLGMWNSYQSTIGYIRPVNCITLSRYGDIKIRFNSYQSLKKVQRKIANGKTKLKPNLLKT
jgi:hypothetical protein